MKALFSVVDGRHGFMHDRDERAHLVPAFDLLSCICVTIDLPVSR